MKGVWRSTRRFITLIEIMIVMTLIAMILGVVAYNYQGALEEGRAFETRANIEKIRTILTLKVANDPGAIDSVQDKWKDYVKSSPLVQNPEKVVRDGWGDEYKVTVEQSDEGNPVITVKSPRLEAFEKSK
ncbi:MAG: hypothetical protein Q8K75_09105 [Chlamydiales bacterium]|nr:hypothetical protein [Chlamydiales bacterium]